MDLQKLQIITHLFLIGSFFQFDVQDSMALQSCFAFKSYFSSVYIATIKFVQLFVIRLPIYIPIIC